MPATYLIDEMTPSGFIALQVHSVGPEQGGLQVRYRNVLLRTEDLTPSGRSFPYVVDTRPNQLSEAEAALGWELLFDGENTEAWRGAHREDFPGDRLESARRRADGARLGTRRTTGVAGS